MSTLGSHAKSVSLHLYRQPVPKLTLPKLLCDDMLHKKLETFAITSLMNKSFACAVLGRAGSGKTSLVSALLESKGLFNKVFDKILLFMPPNSRKSIQDSCFDTLPQNQVYDGLTLATLQSAFAIAENMSRDDKHTLIIFDDVQQYFKGECEPLLVHMLNNRRHNRLSMFFVAQTYKKLPKMARMGLSDVFMFNLSKDDMLSIFDELVEISQNAFFKAVEFYKRMIKQTNKKMFLYLNTTSQRLFIDWDELAVSEDFVEDAENEVEESNSTVDQKEEEEHPPSPPGSPKKKKRKTK